MSDYIRTKELAEVLGLSRKSVLERARKEGWPCVERSGGLQFATNRLPMDIRFLLAGRQNTERTGGEVLAGQAYMAASDKSRETATWRSALLLSFRHSGMRKQDFVEAYNSGQIEAVIYGKLGEISLATFYRWLRDWTANGASGVTPRYGISRGGAGEQLTETEKNLLAKFWLQTSQPTMSHALRFMKANVPYSRCTYSTAARFLKSIPPAIRDKYRLGDSQFENRYLPYMEQNVDAYKSMDRVVSDHHVLDCVCMYHGKLVRPWITTMQDYRSGKVLGWCFSVRPSSLSIIVAYYMMVLQYGAPRELLFDNGKDYRSKILNGWTTTAKALTPEGMTEETEVRFSGIFNICGSEVHFTRTYNGKSKGRQERYFRILAEYLAKDFGTYLGSDTRTQPEEAQLMYRSIDGKAKRDDIPSWEEFLEYGNKMVLYINDKFESQGKGMEGKTRSQVFQENYDPAKAHRVSKETLAAALCTGEVRKCGRNGVKVGGVNYWHPDLQMYVGTEVRVYTSLVSNDEVSVSTLKGEHICNARGNFFLEGGDFKESIRRLTGARRMGLVAVAERGLPEVAAPEGFQTLADVAGGIYHQGDVLDVDQELGITEERKPEQSQLPEPKKRTKKKYTDLLDARDGDYLHLQDNEGEQNETE